MSSTDKEAKSEIVLEEWVSGSSFERVLDSGSIDARELIKSIGPGLSTLLMISIGDRSLIISASRGRYSMTALLGEDDFFDRVGDSALSGAEEFVQGGQRIDVPRRHLINCDVAAEAATEFLESGTVLVQEGWERQGAIGA